MARSPLLLTLVFLVGLGGVATAQTVYVIRESNPYARRHVYLGAEAVGSVLVHQTGPEIFSHGGGINVFLGGRVDKRVAIEAGWSPVFHQSPPDTTVTFTNQHLALQAATLDFKIYPVLGRLQPYVTFGPGAYFLTEWTMRYFGGGVGFQAGGGFDVWLGRHGALGFKAQYRGAGIFDYDPRGTTSYFSMITFSGGFTGHF
jgi:hypothetical protein